MYKAKIKDLDPYFARYVAQVEQENLFDAFEKSLQQIGRFSEGEIDKRGNELFEPGKWTIKQIIQHITDWERILGYRALLILREEGMPAQHDQDDLARHGAAAYKSARLLLNELKAVRFASMLLFKGLDETSLLKTSRSWQRNLSVLEVGFIIVGHQVHHFKVIEEYLSRL